MAVLQRPAGADVESLVTANVALVGHLVREVLGRVPAHVSKDDLTSAGLTALVSAARGFDPSRGTPFGRFAAVRIRGALLDELRSLDWASRSVRHQARRVDAVQQELTAALGRTPSPDELAAALGVGRAELDTLEDDVARAVVLSLQGFADTGAFEDMLPEDGASPEDLLLHRERLGYLRDAIAELPDRLRTVVTGYFLEERPMAEIAAELGVTESRVSQLRAEALALLKDGINAQLDPETVAAPERPDGCVARRRASYYAAVAARGDLTSRLAGTTVYGLPLPQAASA